MKKWLVIVADQVEFEKLVCRLSPEEPLLQYEMQNSIFQAATQVFWLNTFRSELEIRLLPGIIIKDVFSSMRNGEPFKW